MVAGAERVGENVGRLLERHVAAGADRPFLHFEDVDTSQRLEISYGEALHRAGRVAAVLADHGIGAGDRFHVHLTNRPEFYDCWFAAALLGAVIVPTNPLLTIDELRFVVEHAGCGLSISEPDLLQTAEDAQGGTILVAGDSLAEQFGSADPLEAGDHGAETLLAVLYTSGTTSQPKGVLVSHAAYVYCGEAVAQHIRLTPDDRQLIVLPLFHGNAQYYSTMSALVTGASIALASRFSASRWSAQARDLGATVASLFAAPIRMILAAEPGDADREHALRLVLFAQNVSDAQLDEFEERFGVPLAQLYGMTETVAPPTINPIYGERRNATIGPPTLSARVRVIDEDGNDVEPGEPGQLLVGGEPGVTLMNGYLDNPEATEKSLRDGWLYTGDQVRLLEGGYLEFVDRDKDLIKRAGENVSTVEVERVIDEHPAVQESAVLGLPDEMYDHVVGAFVVLREGAECDADELIGFCAERLAKFKVPARVEFMSELPRTPVGKIQKHEIRASVEQAQQ
ncbi:MAG: AMP-binding protein [Solirubrobacterales bacterium]|nr:AMP-binding protein [Solirubrobacterales bacterium]